MVLTLIIGIYDTPLEVVRIRIRSVQRLRHHCGFSTEQIYEAVWKDTLNMMLSLEKRLSASVFSHRKAIALNNPDLSVLRFLDDWFQARDKLWEELRNDALPHPFPQGLPISGLISPFRFQLGSLETDLPYLASRVNAVVFADPHQALQPIRVDGEGNFIQNEGHPSHTDENATIAYDNFRMQTSGLVVEDYFAALSLYIPKTITDQEQQERTERAWKHAIGPLSQPRMSEDEAIRYWENRGKPENKYPKHWPVRLTRWQVVDDWPLVPHTNDPTKTELWNPCVPIKQSRAPARTLETLTYIDLCKGEQNIYSGSFPTSIPLPRSPVQIPAETADDRDIFSPARFSLAKRNPAVMEGVILASLLCLDAKEDEENRILLTAFPNPDPATMRFPALYIDQTIFQDESDEPHFAVLKLERMTNRLPPTLLLRAAKIWMRKLKLLNETMAGMRERTTCRNHLHMILKLLQRSDRPSLASTLLTQYIMNDSESSSWHRMILSPPFLKRLAASDAQARLSYFADTVIHRLGDRSEYAVLVPMETHHEGETQEGSLGTVSNKVRSLIKRRLRCLNPSSSSIFAQK